TSSTWPPGPPSSVTSTSSPPAPPAASTSVSCCCRRLPHRLRIRYWTPVINPLFWGAERVLELPHLQSRVLSNLLDFIYTSHVLRRDDKGKRLLSEAGLSLGVPFLTHLVKEEEEEPGEMKGKSRQGRGGEAMMEDGACGPENAKITLSFPLSAALPAALTVHNHRPSSAMSSPRCRHSSSGSKGSNEGSSWKLAAAATTDKRRPFKQPRHDSSPCSSSSSHSSSLSHGSYRTGQKGHQIPPPLFKAGLDSQFHRFTPRSSNGPIVGYPGEGHRLTNGTASPSDTAQILFNLSAVAYQSQGRQGTERKEKTGKQGGRVGSPQVGPNLHPPTLHLPPLPHPSSSFIPTPLPPHASSTPPDGPKAELICGVCHRLFSSASSLTAHLRLHRGGRALSCQHCGKAFIHNKRLQSHEASCRHALTPAIPSNLPHLPIQPKEEPLEEGEVRVEGGQILGAGEEDMKPGKGKKGRGLLVRHEGDVSELVGDEDHFVKVVDGHVIYFCSVCERSYMTLSSLKRHSNVHSWRRKYPCHFCDKVFALAEYRTKHEVWHTGERRYQCIFCWEAFATYYNLKTHQKAFHGISPGLISSEKTANGGYKQKVNALKFYRLLPMRSQKRPYKTYSDSLANGLQLPPSDPSSVPLPLDCSLPDSLDPGDLRSLISGSLPKGVKPDPEEFLASFPLTVALEQGEIRLPSLTDMALGRVADREPASEKVGSRGSSSKVSVGNRVKTPKVSGSPELGLSSVITYGHPKPSVIVHGTAVSSVIVHSNQVTSGGGKSPLSSPSPESSNSQTLLPKSSAKPVKKHRESTESHRKRAKLVDSSDATEESERRSETGRSHHKSSKSDGSSAKQSSEGKGAGPLCQITVRIGEEAMVKRSISETDLKRDRSPPPSKAKRTYSSPLETKEPRHSHHHHHHHKHRSHRSSSTGAEGERGGDGESRKKSPIAPGKVREYYFRQEVRKQGESEDDEDNLWRPYYSYKPKRKAPHVHKAKNWQAKLHYKRSLRLMKRAEGIMDHVNKEAGEQDEEDGTMDEVEGEVEGHIEQEKGEVPESLSISPIPSKDKEGEEEIQEAHLKTTDPPLASPQPPLATSVSPMDTKRRPWSDGSASECDTCGRWFSSSRKRDKHELSHLLEFVCLLCRAPFPSRDQLEDHQRTRHPKDPDPLSVPPRAGPQSRDEGVERETKLAEVDRARERVILGKGSPSRLSRRSLARHTCLQCHKVCKTSSALNRHVRRHELSSSPEREREETQPEPKAAAETTVSTASKDLDTMSGHVPVVQSVPAISYPVPEPQHSSEGIEAQQCASQPSKVKAEHHIPTLCSSPELHELATPVPDREPSPLIIQPPSEIPMVDIPDSNRPTPSPSSCTSPLQGVLVMSSGAECLDYRTPRKRSLEGQSHRKTSPAPVTGPPTAFLNMHLTSQMRINHTAAPPSVAMTTVPLRGVCGVKREGDIVEKGLRQGCGMGLLHHAGFKDSPVAQDVRVLPLSRSPSPNQAQDLTMSSILAREVERERQREWERDMERELERGRQRERERDMDRELERGRQRERNMDRVLERERRREREMERVQQTRGASQPPQEQLRDKEVILLVPKEEPISPAPSPIHTPIQTTINNRPLQRRPTVSPCLSPTAMDLLMQANRQVSQSMCGTRGPERLQLPTGSVGGIDRPSAHALLLPRVPPPSEAEPQDHSPAPSRDPHRGEVIARGYPMQDYPLPLIVQSGYCSGKKQEDNLLMSYPTGPLAFGPLGKMMPTGDLAKLPFYPDPYHLLYGPQLLAYPYNLASLPMALNMMAPGDDKVAPLPFLPALFNYAAAAGPYTGMLPHHLVANPSLYNSGGSSRKQRDGSGGGKP
ncbi:LOW QUALITY PROTEIN: uncharacterized protein LOC115139080, partial [Oncorhynchus nerka]|uniref:LOW QUALITY PROTEIN: uncharacterized protein LOC115139080 n=1 Tax=Oncorhynchus nerka TaxID=8023 RepID=UPI0031B84BBA